MICWLWWLLVIALVGAAVLGFVLSVVWYVWSAIRAIREII